MSINHLQTLSQPQQPVVMTPQLPQQNQIKNHMQWVQGIEGAKAYLLAPGMTIPLWDSENQCVYIKSSDQNGVPRPLTILDYTIRQAEPVGEVSSASGIDTSKFASKEEINELKDMIADLKELIASKPVQRNNYHGKKGERNE